MLMLMLLKVDVFDNRCFCQSMFLTVGVLEVDVLVVDVLELDVLGARQKFYPYQKNGSKNSWGQIRNRQTNNRQQTTGRQTFFS